MKRVNNFAEDIRRRWELIAALPPNTRPLEALLMGWYGLNCKGTPEAIDYGLTTTEQITLGGKENIIEMLNTPCPIYLLKFDLYSFERLRDAGVHFCGTPTWKE